MHRLRPLEVDVFQLIIVELAFVTSASVKLYFFPATELRPGMSVL
jgi:hypothetical protein